MTYVESCGKGTFLTFLSIVELVLRECSISVRVMPDRKADLT